MEVEEYRNQQQTLGEKGSSMLPLLLLVLLLLYLYSIFSCLLLLLLFDLERQTSPNLSLYFSEFNVTQCGTFFYHSGCQIWKQDTYGLAGMFISHCHEDPPADADFAFFLDGYTFEACLHRLTLLLVHT